MREHCRTQHGYDPEPIPRPPPERQQRTTDLINSTASAPVEKFLKMVAYSRFQQTGIKDSTGNSIVNSMGSIENSLNYLLDNFAIVRKKEFQGISGYFCKKCLSFQYRYIKDIWNERTAKDQHQHKPIVPYDANRSVKEMEGRLQANRLLIELINSLFGRYKIVDVYRCVTSENFHGPVIKYVALNPYHWAGLAITNNGMAVYNEYLKEFITEVEGTYAQIDVANGSLMGKYVIKIQTTG